MRSIDRAISYKWSSPPPRGGGGATPYNFKGRYSGRALQITLSVVICAQMSVDALISLSGALIALTLSALSLGLHWIKRTQTPEYTALSAQIRALEAEIIDLMDKVKHWRNRDMVRNAREGSAKKAEEAQAPDTPKDYKDALRRKATAAGFGIAR